MKFVNGVIISDSDTIDSLEKEYTSLEGKLFDIGRKLKALREERSTNFKKMMEGKK